MPQQNYYEVANDDGQYSYDARMSGSTADGFTKGNRESRDGNVRDSQQTLGLNSSASQNRNNYNASNYSLQREQHHAREQQEMHTLDQSKSSNAEFQ